MKSWLDCQICSWQSFGLVCLHLNETRVFDRCGSDKVSQLQAEKAAGIKELRSEEPSTWGLDLPKKKKNFFGRQSFLRMPKVCIRRFPFVWEGVQCPYLSILTARSAQDQRGRKSSELKGNIGWNFTGGTVYVWLKSGSISGRVQELTRWLHTTWRIPPESRRNIAEHMWNRAGFP